VRSYGWKKRAWGRAPINRKGALLERCRAQWRKILAAIIGPDRSAWMFTIAQPAVRCGAPLEREAFG
jgi:hypothetical protein